MYSGESAGNQFQPIVGQLSSRLRRRFVWYSFLICSSIWALNRSPPPESTPLGAQFGSPHRLRARANILSYSLLRCASANFLNFSVSAASFRRRSSFATDRSGSPASSRIRFRSAISRRRRTVTLSKLLGSSPAEDNAFVGLAISDFARTLPCGILGAIPATAIVAVEVNNWRRLKSGRMATALSYVMHKEGWRPLHLPFLSRPHPLSGDHLATEAGW
jgi:hypothetical protein